MSAHGHPPRVTARQPWEGGARAGSCAQVPGGSGSLAAAARQLGMFEKDIFDSAPARSAWRSLVVVWLGAGNARLSRPETPPRTPLNVTKSAHAPAFAGVDRERILLNELEQYQPELLERPRLVVGTKSDSAVHDWDGEMISSITQQGVRELVQRLSTLVFEARQSQPENEGIVIIRPEAEGGKVERLGEHEFRLHGRQVERVVALNDVTTPEALNYIDYALKRLNVHKMLAKAGAQEGDVIWISSFSFEYRDDV